jgi:two-component system response regulator AdeR
MESWMNDASAHTGGRATPDQMQRKHVYVLNGSSDFLDIIRALLQDEQYNVTTTNFVPQSFSTIEAAQPSLVILDLVHGELAGWDLLAELRRAASTQGIPLLLVSTLQEELDQAKAQDAGFAQGRYLQKPFDLDELLAVIEEMIGPASS